MSEIEIEISQLIPHEDIKNNYVDLDTIKVDHPFTRVSQTELFNIATKALISPLIESKTVSAFCVQFLHYLLTFQIFEALDIFFRSLTLNGFKATLYSYLEMMGSLEFRFGDSKLGVNKVTELVYRIFSVLKQPINLDFFYEVINSYIKGGLKNTASICLILGASGHLTPNDREKLFQKFAHEVDSYIQKSNKRDKKVSFLFNELKWFFSENIDETEHLLGYLNKKFSNDPETLRGMQQFLNEEKELSYAMRVKFQRIMSCSPVVVDLELNGSDLEDDQSFEKIERTTNSYYKQTAGGYSFKEVWAAIRNVWKEDADQDSGVFQNIEKVMTDIKVKTKNCNAALNLLEKCATNVNDKVVISTYRNILKPYHKPENNLRILESLCKLAVYSQSLASFAFEACIMVSVDTKCQKRSSELCCSIFEQFCGDNMEKKALELIVELRNSLFVFDDFMPIMLPHLSSIGVFQWKRIVYYAIKEDQLEVALSILNGRKDLFIYKTSFHLVEMFITGHYSGDNVTLFNALSLIRLLLSDDEIHENVAGKIAEEASRHFMENTDREVRRQAHGILSDIYHKFALVRQCIDTIKEITEDGGEDADSVHNHIGLMTIGKTSSESILIHIEDNKELDSIHKKSMLLTYIHSLDLLSPLGDLVKLPSSVGKIDSFMIRPDAVVKSCNLASIIETSCNEENYYIFNAAITLTYSLNVKSSEFISTLIKLCFSEMHKIRIRVFLLIAHLIQRYPKLDWGNTFISGIKEVKYTVSDSERLVMFGHLWYLFRNFTPISEECMIRMLIDASNEHPLLISDCLKLPSLDRSIFDPYLKDI